MATINKEGGVGFSVRLVSYTEAQKELNGVCLGREGQEGNMKMRKRERS